MAFLDPINTIATKRIVPGVTDLVFKDSPTLMVLRRNALRKYQGGPSWQENFLYGVLNNDAYVPGESHDTSQVQVATGTTITPRYYNVVVSAILEKLRVEMNGPEAVFDYVDLLLQTAALTLSGRLANDIYRHGQSLSGSERAKYLNGMDEAFNDGTTTGFDGRTYASYLTLTRNDANIGSALNSPMTGPAADVNGSITYPILEQAFQSVTYGAERPDLIVTTPLGSSFIKMAFQAQQRFDNITDPDFGFDSIRFNGSKIVVDRYAPGTATASAADTRIGYSAVATGETLWFINTKYARLYVSTDPLYAFGFTGFLPAQNNSTVVGHYKYCGNFTYVAPRYSRVLFDITG